MRKSASVSLLMACVVGGSALYFIAVRPCEPVAQAAEMSLEVPEHEMVITTVLEPGTFTPAPAPKPAHHMAAIAKHPAKDRVCGWYELMAGPKTQYADHAHVWDCR